MNSVSSFCRDFAIRNCLVTADLGVKVGDYGLAEETYKVSAEQWHLWIVIPLDAVSRYTGTAHSTDGAC